jgi:hypothetical protein
MHQYRKIGLLMIGKFLPHMAFVKKILYYQHSNLQMHQHRMIDLLKVGKFLLHMLFESQIRDYLHSYQ